MNRSVKVSVKGSLHCVRAGCQMLDEMMEAGSVKRWRCWLCSSCSHWSWVPGAQRASGIWEEETRGSGLWPHGALCLRSGVKTRDHGKQLDIFDERCDAPYAILQYSFRKIIADMQCNNIDGGELFKVNSNWGVLLQPKWKILRFQFGIIVQKD